MHMRAFSSWTSTLNFRFLFQESLQSKCTLRHFFCTIVFSDVVLLLYSCSHIFSLKADWTEVWNEWTMRLPSKLWSDESITQIGYSTLIHWCVWSTTFDNQTSDWAWRFLSTNTLSSDHVKWKLYLPFTQDEGDRCIITTTRIIITSRVEEMPAHPSFVFCGSHSAEV